MDILNTFPATIREHIGTRPLTPLTDGRSGDTVYDVGSEAILKVTADTVRAARERDANDRLCTLLPVSKTIAFETADGLAYYLKTRVQGTPLTDPRFLKDPEKLAELLAEGIRMFHGADIPCGEGECLVHGDFCLPNILVADGHVCGFIDTEAAGPNDPWIDYAWCIWSYEYNLGTDRHTPMLLEKLGIEFDRERYLRYTED